MDKERQRLQVQTHYGNDSDWEIRIEELLAERGLLDKELTPEELAPFDQFHAGGLVATAELSELLSIRASTKILDVGSGLGGPSRYLAYRFGCHVTGIDLSPSYCRVAERIARLMGLDDKVSYRSEDALNIPFSDGAFDIVWTQHAAMNIADREALYKGVARVLKPCGYFAMYDVVRAMPGPLQFPVPWASTSQYSHLLTATETLALLTKEGFESHIWDDVSARALEWFKVRETANAFNNAGRLNLGVVMGDKFRLMATNYRRNLEAGTCGVLQAVLQKRDPSKECCHNSR
jgi:SAM-dependent methyltransferase